MVLQYFCEHTNHFAATKSTPTSISLLFITFVIEIPSNLTKLNYWHTIYWLNTFANIISCQSSKQRMFFLLPVAVHHPGAILLGYKRRWRGKSSVAAPHKADYMTSHKPELLSWRQNVPFPKESQQFEQGLKANGLIRDGVGGGVQRKLRACSKGVMTAGSLQRRNSIRGCHTLPQDKCGNLHFQLFHNLIGREVDQNGR